MLLGNDSILMTLIHLNPIIIKNTIVKISCDSCNTLIALLPTSSV